MYSPYYYTDEAIQPDDDETALTITYRPSKTSSSFELVTGTEEIIPVPLPQVSSDNIETVRYTLQLQDDREIAGFRLASEDGDPGQLVSVQFGADTSELVLAENYFTGSEHWHTERNNGYLDIYSDTQAEILELVYVYRPDSPVEIEEGIQIGSGLPNGPLTKQRLYLKRGEHRVYLFPWLWSGNGDGSVGGGKSGTDDSGENPADRFAVRYRIETPPSGFVSLRLRPLVLSPDFAVPVPADMSAIMHYPQGSWRDKEYELFSWNLFPDILVFDTADYGTQAAFFKRIAFYVEKKGYTGQILADSDLADKHGWNAHDYRSIDLASFFQAAADRRFELNEYELLLRDILLKNGIIGYDDKNGVYLPKKGGLISISRSSSEYLRKLFLTHEGMHGIFFSSAPYRERCFTVWERLSPEMQLYWDRFFRWMSYDSDNLYLVVNELQAYLLQQRTAEAEYYFRNHRSVPGLEADGKAGDAVRSLLNGSGTPFRDAAEQVRQELYKTTGIWHERFFCLELK